MGVTRGDFRGLGRKEFRQHPLSQEITSEKKGEAQTTRSINGCGGVHMIETFGPLEPQTPTFP